MTFHVAQPQPGPEIKRSALISGDGLYRYRLERFWGAGHALPFVMLNPSTADGMVDDPTIRRCMGFARREGRDGIVVCNLFGLIATNPAALKNADDPFGPCNHGALSRLVKVWGQAFSAPLAPVVCAWGARGSLKDANEIACQILLDSGADLVCLGKTKDGHPRHPLYVRADQPLEPFP